MITTGIDLAAQDKTTAACTIRWTDPLQVEIEPECGDAKIGRILGRASAGKLDDENTHWVAIDAPFGWPKSFSDAVKSWADGDEWRFSYGTHAKALRHRDCDLELGKMLRSHATSTNPPSPIAVSADKIGATAMRCAYLLGQWAANKGQRCVHERGLPIVECYPAAALSSWGICRTGYKAKGKSNAMSKDKSCRRILADLKNELRLGDVPIKNEEDVVRSDHSVDAFVAALVARAAALGFVHERRELKNPHEGWIELPLPESLSGLLQGDLGR